MITIKFFYPKSIWGIFPYISKGNLNKGRKQIKSAIAQDKACSIKEEKIATLSIPSNMDDTDKILIEVSIQDSNISLTEKNAILKTIMKESETWFSGGTVRVQLGLSIINEEFV